MNQHHSMKLNYTSLLRTLLIQKFTTNITAKEIYWFNLPFSRNVSTKFDKYFLNPLDMHFSQNHRLHKIFNRNNVKVSYSCTKSMKTINNHNKNILGKKPYINTSALNCRNKAACPLNRQCQIGEVV